MFITESRHVLGTYFDADIPDNSNTVDIPCEYENYIKQHYNVKVFDLLDTSGTEFPVRSILRRLQNTLAVALNKFNKLPKYILLIIENNLLKCINFKKLGITELIGVILNWLA